MPRLTIAGGFAKLVKLAQGHLFLHSSKSQVDVPALAAVVAELGAPADGGGRGGRTGSAAQVLSVARAPCACRLPSASPRDARAVARAVLGGETAVEVLVFDRAGGLIGRAGFDA